MQREANNPRRRLMDLKWLPLYFFLGGTIVALVTYFGSRGKGTIAAFVAFFPSVTLLTLLSVYFSGGVTPTVSYLKSALFLMPAWIIYAVAVIFILPRWGLVTSVIAGVALYVGVAVMIMRLVH
jgi:uncharacterized membrane protein (GlpM family)